MQQVQEDFFDDKIFALKPFKLLFNTFLVISIFIVIISCLFFLFFPSISNIFNLAFPTNFNTSVIILCFLAYGLIQQQMLRKILIIQNFQDKVKAYFKFYKTRLILIFTVLILSCLLLIINGTNGDFFWIIINAGLLIFLKPSTKIISQELKETDINFI